MPFGAVPDEVPEADAVEQRTDPWGGPVSGDGTPPEVSPGEAPEHDLAEQERPVLPDEQQPSEPSRVPLDADPADLVDQQRPVAFDEDDYRDEDDE
ncbi:MAG TPA: hypothetical protein VIL00_00625 [Pseudonocardiaceae bacterium]